MRPHKKQTATIERSSQQNRSADNRQLVALRNTLLGGIMKMELFADKFEPSADDIVNDLYGDLYVYVDGRFLKGAEARISVFDRGLLYGDGVFEGLRVYGSKVFMTSSSSTDDS